MVTMSYIGGQNNAHDTSVQGDLRNIAAAMKSYRANTGSYPSNSSAISTMDATEGVNPRVTRSSYDVEEELSDGHVRNLLICKRDGTSPAFGIAALSKSGKSWLYMPSGEIVQNAVAWTGTSSLCTQLGVSSGDGYANWFAYDRVTTTPAEDGWRGWATK